MLPASLARFAQPWLEVADDTLQGTDDDAVSRRVAVSVFMIRVFSAAIAFLSQVFLARMMGEFEYGIFVGVWVAIVILGNLSCLGFPTSVILFIGKYREMGDQDALRGTIIGSMSFTMISSVFIAIVGGGTFYYYQDAVASYYVLPIFIAIACLPMLSLQEVQDGVSRAFNWPGTALTPTFIVRPILILMFMLGAVLLGYPATAVTAMTASIIATYIASTGQFVRLFGKLKKAVPKGPVRFFPVEWIVVALPIFLVEGFYVLLTSVDILFVSRYMQPQDVAVYFAAVKTLALVHFVYFAVKAAAAHRFSAYMTSGNRVRFEQYVARTVRWTFWPSLVLALVMMVIGKYFLMLFGESFVAGTGLLWILAIGIIIRASVGPAESVLTMSGQQNACALVYISTLVINVALNATLIPIYGLHGAAIATTIAMAFESAALFSVAKRQLGLHVFIIPAKPPEMESGEAASK